MFNFKYEIKISDEDIPYIKISDETVNHPEHKFMGLEFARYLLNDLLNENKELQELSPQTEIEIAKAGHILEQLSSEIGRMLIEQKNALSDLDDLNLTVEDGED